MAIAMASPLCILNSDWDTCCTDTQRLVACFTNSDCVLCTCQVLVDPVHTVAAEAVTAGQHQWHSVCAVVVFIADLTADRHMQLRVQQATSAVVLAQLACTVGLVVLQYDYGAVSLEYHILTRAISV